MTENMLSSLNTVISSGIHYSANDRNVSFFMVGKKNPVMYTHHIFLICSSLGGHLGWFHHSAVVNSAAVTTGVQVSLEDADVVSSGEISRRDPRLLKQQSEAVDARQLSCCVTVPCRGEASIPITASVVKEGCDGSSLKGLPSEPLGNGQARSAFGESEARLDDGWSQD